MKPQRQNSRPGPYRFLISAAIFTVLLGVGNPAGASSSSALALRIAEYAVATATHDDPSHVVTAADVSNAAGISTVNTSNLALLINLGDLLGYSRLVVFFSSTTYADTCVDLPDTDGGAPKVTSCPRRAHAWGTQGEALNVSNMAIAAAAVTGRAVSGANVVAAAKVNNEKLRYKPTFLAGQGGKVEFTTLVETGPNTKFTVNNCVQLPRTAYGIPVSVPC